MPDHIHPIVSASPSVSPSELIKHLKGYTARKLGEEYPWLRKRDRILVRGY
jgi:putative transposase